MKTLGLFGEGHAVWALQERDSKKASIKKAANAAWTVFSSSEATCC